MADNFIMILPSDACMDTYPLNSVTRFRVNVPSRLNFTDDWAVALQSVVFPKATVAIGAENNAGDHMWIYSDCVEPLLVGDNYHSVLAIVPFSNQGIFMPPNLLYMPVRKGDRQSISVWCANHIGNPYPFEKEGRLILILHFKRLL